MAKKETKGAKQPSKQDRVKVREEIFDRTIARWLEVEEETIASADKLMSASQDLLVVQMMNLIRRDSEKHREILKTIQAIQSGVVAVSPDSIGEIDKLLNHHKQIEHESLILGRTAKDHSRSFIIRQLLDYLLEDERKHIAMTESVEEYKRKSI